MTEKCENAILEEGVLDWIKTIKNSDYYHATDIHGIHSIAMENSLRLSYAMKEPPEFSAIDGEQFYYYFSLSDRRLSGFLKNRFRFGGNSVQAIITFKNKIVKDFAGRAVTFFEAPYTGKKKPDTLLVKIRSEDEYRIVSNSPKIKDASKYITKIEIIALEDKDKPSSYRTLNLLDRKYNVVVYTSMTEFYKKKGGISVKDYLSDTPTYSINLNFNKKSYALIAKDMDNFLGELNNFITSNKSGKLKLPKGFSLMDLSSHINDHPIYGKRTKNINTFHEILKNHNETANPKQSVYDYLFTKAEERF